MATILSFEDLEICTSYKIDNKLTEEVPFQMTHAAIDPQYKDFKGWNKETSSIKNPGELPVEMKDYIRFINNYLGTEVKFISNGPGRDQIIKV